ncbi:hypothetical protein QQF64_022342 [Cirrhinus molitorella]|uniref:Uncharacterized protein n=1 Tax=Cirrhinus molitorella TaxID=172907 RepID=A0ABR3LBG5_9TELE
MFLLLSIPSRIWGWREAVGQAVWAARYLKPESTLPPCVSFIGDYGENLQVMRSDRLTAIALASLLLEKCEDGKREPKHSRAICVTIAFVMLIMLCSPMWPIVYQPILYLDAHRPNV